MRELRPQVCESPAEARRDAARVALMNSLVNDLPCRHITPKFIAQSLEQAAKHSAVTEDTHSFLQQLVTGQRAGTGTQQKVQTVTRIIVFAKASVEDACDSSTSIGTYSLLLHSYTGRTMLEFQVRLSAKVNSLARLRLF